MNFFIPPTLPNLSRQTVVDKILLDAPNLSFPSKAHTHPNLLKIADIPLNKNLLGAAVYLNSNSRFFNVKNDQMSWGLGNFPEMDISHIGIGLRTKTQNATQHYLVGIKPTPIVGQGWGTVFVLGRTLGAIDAQTGTATSTICQIGGCMLDYGTGKGIYIHLGASNTVHAATSVNSWASAQIGTATTGIPFVGFIWHDLGSNTYKAQFNQDTIVNVGSSETPDYTPALSYLCTGHLMSLSSTTGDKTVFLMAMWNRQLSDIERFQLYLDPYCILTSK